MKRVQFNDSLTLTRPGEVPIPSRLSHRCMAHGCPLAGAMGSDSNSNNWWCAYHYSANPLDLPKITELLRTHGVLTDLIVESRRYHADIHSPAASAHERYDRHLARLQQRDYQINEKYIGKGLRTLAYGAELVLGTEIHKALA